MLEDRALQFRARRARFEAAGAVGPRPGARRVVVVPSPYCPWVLSPQQIAWPLPRMPHVWNAPAEIESAVDTPVLVVGSSRFVVVPSPICPDTLPPEQKTVPLARTTQLWLPVASATTSDVSMPRGEVCSVTVLLLIPSCPTLLRPQHSTSPSNMRAHVLADAAAMATAPVRKVGVGVLNLGVRGVALSVVVKSPSCPNWLSPQHCTPAPLRSTQV